MNSCSENLPEYLPLDDLETRSRGRVVRVVSEVRGRRKGGERGEICEQRPVMLGALRVRFYPFMIRNWIE